MGSGYVVCGVIIKKLIYNIYIYLLFNLKNKIMKKIYITIQMLFVLVMANAQNWSYVGSQNFSAGTTLGAYKYFGDMEIDATGNIYVGYWDNGDKINFVKSNGNGWTVLPTPGLCSVLNILDVEVQG